MEESRRVPSVVRESARAEGVPSILAHELSDALRWASPLVGEVDSFARQARRLVAMAAFHTEHDDTFTEPNRVADLVRAVATMRAALDEVVQEHEVVLDGLACAHCGETGGGMIPVGVLNGGQIFAHGNCQGQQ